MLNSHSLQATMLKKRKHKIKRRNTEPTTAVNHQMVLATHSTGMGGGGSSTTTHHPQIGILGPDGSDGTLSEHPPNLADICDSPTHATAV